MELKHDLLYGEERLVVKTEPRLHSPTSNGAPPPATNGVAGSNGFALNGGPFSGLGKRPRTDEWPPTSGGGQATPGGGGSAPLTPSPGPPSHSYTVASNGYSSPMSSGSYDPYSPNGKIGKFYFLKIFFFLIVLSMTTTHVAHLFCVVRAEEIF